MATVGTLVVKLQADISDFAKNMEAAMGKVQRSVNAAAPASKVLLGGMTVLAGAFATVGAASVKMAADMEQSKIAFTTMLGSAQAANTFLRQLEEFAARTPFELPGLQDASRKLLAFGFQAKDIIPLMTSVGDAVAALGGGAAEINRVVYALGQMRAKGKVSAEEMMQLAELGVPAWEMLAKKIGVDIPTAMKMAEKGAIPAAEGIDAIVSGMNARFAGSMDKMSKTILGLWSTAKDQVSAIMRGLGQEIIGTFDLQAVMETVTTQLGQIADLVRQKGLREALAELVPPDLRDKLVIIAGAIAGALVPALVSLATSLWAAVAPLAPFIAAGATLAAVGLAIYKNWDTVRAALSPLQGIWEGLQAVFGRTVEALKGSLTPAIGALKQAWEDLKPVLALVAGVLGTALASAVGLAIGVLNGLVRAIGPLAQAFGGLVSTVSGMVMAIVKLLTGDLRGAWDSLVQAGNGIIRMFSGLVGAVIGFVRGLVDGVVTWFRNLFNALIGHSIIPDLINGILQWFRSLPGQALAVFRGMVDNLIATWSNLASQAISWGRDMVQGIINGLVNMIPNAIAAAGQLASAIGNKVKAFFGISSPSALMAEYGRMVAEGLRQGMAERQGAVANQAQLMAQAITGALDTVTQKLDLTAQIAQARFDLLKVKMGETGNQSTLLKAQLEMLQAQLQAQNDKVAVVTEAYNRMKAAKGEAAAETQKLYLQLLQEQKAQVDLQNAITETTKKLQEQTEAAAGWVRGLDGVLKKIAEITDEYTAIQYEGGVVKYSNKSKSNPWREKGYTVERTSTGGYIAVPKWANGGVLTRPTLLTDLATMRPVAIAGEAGPEVVAPAAALAGVGGGMNITVNVYGSVGVKDIAEQLVREIRLRTGLRI